MTVGAGVRKEKGPLWDILAPGPGGNGSGQFLGRGASGARGPVQRLRAMLWPGQRVMDEASAAYGRCPPALTTPA